MTYWVNDLQRRIYAAVQGWDELLEEEHTKMALRAEGWTCYGVHGVSIQHDYVYQQALFLHRLC